MKDLLLNFSWDKLISLPPTEFLAFIVLAGLSVGLILVLMAVAVSFFD